MLVKCDESDPERMLQGYRSGKRSAIIILTDDAGSKQYFRLKGCGNLNLGFNLQPMAYPPEWLEIRGV